MEMVPTREKPRRIDFVAVFLPQMFRVKRCWVASELDVAARDDHCAVVVDVRRCGVFRRLAAGIARRQSIAP